MATRDIKTKLTLEGTAEFKRQMQEAASSMTELNSESQLIEAQFRATGDQSQYLQDKIENLKEKIDVQKEAVEAAKGALESLKEQGIDESSDAFKTWQTKLNRAQEKLINLQTDLNNAESDFDDLGNEIVDTGDQAEKTTSTMENMGKAISIDGIKESIDSITSGIENIASKAAGAVKALAEMGGDAGAWADDLLTESSIYGLDTDTIQQMRHASKFIDAEVGTIEQSYTRLVKKMGEAQRGSETAVMAFDNVGISFEDVDGNMRDGMTVFYEIIDVLGQMENQAQRDSAAMELFGRSALSLNPLIEAGSEAYKETMAQAPVVAEEQVQALGAVKDAYDDLDSQLEVTKMELLASLAPAFQAGAEALSGFVKQFREFIQTEDGQKALTGLQEAMTALVNSFTGEGNIESIFTAIQSAIEGVTKALEWIKDNADAIGKAVTAIGAAFGLLKVSSTVLSFLKLAQNAKNLFGGTGGGGAVASAASKLGGGAAGMLTKAGSFVAPAAAAVAPYAVLAGGVYLGGRALDQYATERDWGEYNANVANMGALTDTAQSQGNGELAEIIQEINDAFEADEEYTLQMIKDAIASHKETLSETLPDMELDLGEDAFGMEWFDLAKEIVNSLSDKIESGMIEGISAESGSAEAEATEAASTAAAAAETEASTGGNTAGSALASGMAAGINEHADEVTQAAQALAEAVASTINSALDIHSPSRVMARAGGFVAQGFAAGINDGIEDVERAATKMAGAVNTSAARASGWSVNGQDIARGLTAAQFDRMIENGMAASMGGVMGRMDKLIGGQHQGDFVFNINGREFARATASDMDRELGGMSKWRGGSRA